MSETVDAATFQMRFIAAQFSAVLKDNLWLKSAAHTKCDGAKGTNAAEQIPSVSITQKVEATRFRYHP